MEAKIQQLTDLLLSKNDKISAGRARVWIELLWSDFESSSAKAGYGQADPTVIERIITQWIQAYGSDLHAFAGRNPKYIHLLDASDDLTN